MYNRYIPQADGTYRRSRIPEAIPKPVGTVPPPVPPEPAPPPPAQPPQRNKQPRPARREPSRESVSIPHFLRQLLPRDLDSGDLLVVMLLLLMCGDRSEDQNTALLTLALYLFL